MTKAKLKIAGCFRTRKGADDYLGIMSYVYTARKQGHKTRHAGLQIPKAGEERVFRTGKKNTFCLDRPAGISYPFRCI